MHGGKMNVNIKCPYCAKEIIFSAEDRLETVTCDDCKRSFVIELEIEPVIYIQAKLSQRENIERLKNNMADRQNIDTQRGYESEATGTRSIRLSVEVIKAIREYGIKNSMTQKQLAEKIGIKYPMFNKIMQHYRGGEKNCKKVLAFYHEICPVGQYTEARS